MKTINWKPTNTHPKRGAKVLLLFGGNICTGVYRRGRFGEPQQKELAYRADFYGRNGTPDKWSELPN